MERAKDIQYFISKEKQDHILSLDPKIYVEKVTVFYPLLEDSGTKIVFVDSHYPPKKLSERIKGTETGSDWFYLLQIEKKSLHGAHFLLNRFISGETITKCNREQCSLLTKLFKKLYRTTNIEPDAVLRQLYIKVMLQYFVEILITEEGFKDREELLVKKFLALLNGMAVPNHHVKYYAGLLFVSRRYLTWCVQKILGYSPKSIIDAQLAEKSKELLQTSETLYSIADILLFESPSSFSTFFKKHTGLTPSAYRIQIKKTL